MSFINDLKHSIKRLFIYHTLGSYDHDHNDYWQSRDKTATNEFQAQRIELIQSVIDSQDSLMDLGCGNTNILRSLKEQGHKGDILGVDSSVDILEHAGDVKVKQVDLADEHVRVTLPKMDVLLFLEVLEHMMVPEDVLLWAISHAKKGVIFSVPNTGYVFHRLRLLFGRFPMQWKLYPAEHVRFWTVCDMKWWLGQLGIKNYKLKVYKGFPILNKVWPSMFGAGIFVYIKK